MSVPLPTVHLNGTSKRMLLEGYQNAWQSLQTTIETLAKAECHPRDYYVHPDPDAYIKARDQRDKQFEDLRRIQQEIEVIVHHIS